MKIENINNWLPKAYYPVFFRGIHLGNYSTRESAQLAYDMAKADEDTADGVKYCKSCYETYESCT